MLEHAGVLFPPEYEPHGVKMLYHGVPVDLTPEEEEVATFFAVMKDTGGCGVLCLRGGRGAVLGRGGEGRRRRGSWRAQVLGRGCGGMGAGRCVLLGADLVWWVAAGWVF